MAGEGQNELVKASLVTYLQGANLANFLRHGALNLDSVRIRLDVVFIINKNIKHLKSGSLLVYKNKRIHS